MKWTHDLSIDDSLGNSIDVVADSFISIHCVSFGSKVSTVRLLQVTGPGRIAWRPLKQGMVNFLWSFLWILCLTRAILCFQLLCISLILQTGVAFCALLLTLGTYRPGVHTTCCIELALGYLGIWISLFSVPMEKDADTHCPVSITACDADAGTLGHGGSSRAPWFHAWVSKSFTL